MDGPTDADRTLLEELVGADTARELFGLHEKIVQDPKAKAQTHGSVQTSAIEDKLARSRFHSVSTVEVLTNAARH